MVELNQQNEQKKEQNSPGTVTRFGRVVKAFVIADAAMVLFLTFGFVLPRHSGDLEPGGMPADFYSYNDKISPFTQPVPEPLATKVEVPKITARGDNPTFVPAQNASLEFPGVYPAAYANTETAVQLVSLEQTGDHADAYVVPARVESPAAYRVSPAAVNRSSSREIVPAAIMPKAVRPLQVESPAMGASVESVDERSTTM